VLALLALGCFPLLAHADSSEVEYQDAPPTVTGGKAPNDHGPSAGSSNVNNGGASAPGGKGGSGGSSGGGSSEGGSSGSGGGAGSTKDGGTGQQGSPGKHSGNGSIASGKTAAGTHEASSQDSGGSSPLVPILVALAALAAISLGVVTIRQRRRRGSPRSRVSPEAS
jgi:cobalamin biosynthesis Mg chelatase CobN